jgi:hypothetical protein
MIHKIVKLLQRQTFFQILAKSKNNDETPIELTNLKGEIEKSMGHGIQQNIWDKLLNLFGDEKADNSLKLTNWLEEATCLKKQIGLGKIYMVDNLNDIQTDN